MPPQGLGRSVRLCFDTLLAPPGRAGEEKNQLAGSAGVCLTAGKDGPLTFPAFAVWA